jgi:hypothetical protein
MPKRSFALVLLSLVVSLPASGQWSFDTRLELRANVRHSSEQRHPLRFRFPALPVGAAQGFLETPDPGTHAELSVASLQLDMGWANWLSARAKVHVQDLYRRNPTSSDRKIDADELFVRIGPKPEFLELPAGTSFFVQAGKAPKMERQPVRLLESYGLAATSFNRFEDVQLLVGGSVGRNFYWRLQAANGNPLFMRDPNALAGDNGTPELRARPNVDPVYGSGFPIIYNAETEDLFFTSDHVQYGEALGWRWATEDQASGIDVIVFHYERDMAREENLTGTFYGGDLDLLDGVGTGGLATHGNKKAEYGSRVYGEWRCATAVAQYTKQHIAGLQRHGWEAEVGYRLPFEHGWITSVQPALRGSSITNRFEGDPVTFPAPSLWWNWKKWDGGVRVGLRRGVDVTVEYTRHSITSPRPIDLEETLLTVRWRR